MSSFVHPQKCIALFFSTSSLKKMHKKGCVHSQIVAEIPEQTDIAAEASEEEGHICLEETEMTVHCADLARQPRFWHAVPDLACQMWSYSP